MLLIVCIKYSLHGLGWVSVPPDKFRWSEPELLHFGLFGLFGPSLLARSPPKSQAREEGHQYAVALLIPRAKTQMLPYFRIDIDNSRGEDQAGILKTEIVAKRISNNQVLAGHAPSFPPQMDWSPPKMGWSVTCVL